MPDLVTCSECGRKVVRTARNQVTCGSWKCHNARTARLAREKYRPTKRGRYLKGDYPKSAPDVRHKCHTPGCTHATQGYWCSLCRKKRGFYTRPTRRKK